MEVKANKTGVKSGIFYLASSIGLIEAYCEMEIDGGGYTFLPTTALTAATSLLNKIYTDKTKILFRILARNNSTYQPYIITQQLPTFSNVPIGIVQNGFSVYTTPLYAGNKYILIGFLPNVTAAVKTAIRGIRANGINITFVNCDYQGNSYIVLHPDTYKADPTKYIGYGGFIRNWLFSSKPHPNNTYMPDYYYFLTEVHQGGCGTYSLSTTWTAYYGTAFGVR